MVKAFKNEVTTDRIRLKASAHQKLSTLKPGTILATRRTSNALIMNTDKPSVRTVTGIVRKIRIGRKIMLTIPRTTATIIATMKLSTFTPGNMYEVINTAEAFKRSWAKAFMITSIVKSFPIGNICYN